jgi:hypothetical protein
VGCFWPMPPWLDLAELALTAGLASLCLIGRRMRMGKKQHAAAAGTAPHAGAAARQDRAERWRRGWSGWGPAVECWTGKAAGWLTGGSRRDGQCSGEELEARRRCSVSASSSSKGAE